MSYAPQPTPAAPGQPGSYAPPVAKKRKKWPLIVGGVLLMMILGCVGVFALFGAGANEVAKSLDEADKNIQGENAVAGTVGKATRDGKFDFTVTAVKCGVGQIGPEGLADKAQGEFCLINVTVKNVAKTAEAFTSSSSSAFDAKGTKFDNDSGAEMSANTQSQTFFENINPGNQVKGVLVFDVPKGTRLTSVILHESMGTPGVKVALK